MTATLTVAALTERGLGERRVALVPDTVTRLVAGGFEVLIEAGAGAGAFHPDDEYVAAGAKTDTLESVLESADVLLAVRRPEPEILALLRRGAGRRSVATRQPRPKATKALVQGRATIASSTTSTE